MTHSSRSRTIAAAFATALCVGTLSAQFAVAQAMLDPAVQRAEPTAVKDQDGKRAPAGVVLQTEDQRVGQRAIDALRSADPATYRIETTDPKTGRRTVLGSLSPDVLERSAPQVASAQHRAAGRRFITIIIIITVRSGSNAAAYNRLNAALRGADAASYSLTEVH